MSAWREKLKKKYSQARSKIRFGSFRHSVVDTDDIFVDLTLLQDRTLGSSCTNNNTLSSYSELFTITDDKRETCTHVLLRGVAGSGKSTLISRIAYLWATDTDILAKFQLVITLDVRKFAPGDNLERAITNQLLPGVQPPEIARVLSHVASKCLYLIDGFDELSQKSWDDESHVLDSPLLEDGHVVVTTRPHMVSRFCQRYLTFAHVQLSGFSEESVREYIIKFFKIQNNAKLGVSLSKRISQVPVLLELSRFPILLLMLCHLWLDPDRDHDLPESLTELYGEGISYLNKHWEERYRKDTDKVVKELGQVAIDTLFDDKLFFYEKQLGRDCVTDACQIGLVFKEEMEGNRTAVSFIHKTFHEFCSAVYWANLAEEEGLFRAYLKRITLKNLGSMEYLLRFCCGLNTKAALDIIPYVINLVKNDNDWQVPYILFYEIKSQGLVIDNMIANQTFPCPSSIRELTIDKPEYVECDTFTRMLRCIPSLENLTLQDVVVMDKLPMNGGQSSVLPSLKMVNIQSSRIETRYMDVNTLVKLLGCMPHIETMSVCGLWGTLDAGLSVECKLLRRFTLNCEDMNVNLLVRLLECMPSVEVVTVLGIEGRLAAQIPVVCNVLKEFNIKSGCIDVTTLVRLLGCAPAIVALTVGGVRGKLDADISAVCKLLRTFVIKSRSVDVTTLVRLLGYMPSVEVLRLSCVTGILNADISLPCCKLVKTFDVKGAYMDVHTLVRLLGCMPSVEVLTVCGIEGNLKTEISVVCKLLKRFVLRYEDVDVNTLVRLLSCMPSLEMLTVWGVEGTLDSDMFVVCSSLKTFHILSNWDEICFTVLVMFLECTPSVEKLTLCGVELVNAQMPSESSKTFLIGCKGDGSGIIEVSTKTLHWCCLLTLRVLEDAYMICYLSEICGGTFSNLFDDFDVVCQRFDEVCGSGNDDADALHLMCKYLFLRNFTLSRLGDDGGHDVVETSEDEYSTSIAMVADDDYDVTEGEDEDEDEDDDVDSLSSFVSCESYIDGDVSSGVGCECE